MSSYALGLIETKGLIGAIEACDAAAKAANVVVTAAEITDAAYVSLKIEGDLGAVQAAVDAGAVAAEKVGELVSMHVIARPDSGLEPITPPKRYVSKFHMEDQRPRLSPDPDEPSAPVRKKAPAKKKPSVAKAEAAIAPEPPVTKKPEPPVAKPVVQPPPAEKTAAEVSEKTRMTLAELESMPVVKLRRFARTVKDLPLKGRQISMANKPQLIEALKSVMNLE